MRRAPTPQPAENLSYRALRKAVGIIALALPFIVALPWLISHHTLLSSISASYYTNTRNFFVGSLFAVALFMICTRGYDMEDRVAGVLSGIFAICVASIPTAPPSCASLYQIHIGGIHYVFAALLFLTLAYFCFFLFTMSAHGHTLTPEKLQRNIVYRACGGIIVASLLMILLISRNRIPWPDSWIPYGILFETTSLLSFGAAWLVKGEAVPMLNDSRPVRPQP